MKPSLRRITRIAAIICILAVLVVMTGSAVLAATPKPKGEVKNVILLISDGCGFNSFLAGDYYQYGRTGKQVYEKFPTKTAVSTYEYEWATYTEDGKTPLSFEIYGYDTNQFWGDFGYAIQTNPLNPAYINNATDSASSATAMATGSKTRDGSICVDINGNTLENIVDIAEGLGKSTGVITTVPFAHATPAGFVAHNISRDNYAAIANEMLYTSGVDVIMGCGAPDYGYSGEQPFTGNTKYVGGATTWADITDDASVTGADANGDGTADAWTVIRDQSEFQALAKGKTPARVFGLPKTYQSLQYYRGFPTANNLDDPFEVAFTPNIPTLAEMTKGALNVLDNNKKGFFLMVEGGAVDWAAHFYQPGRMIEEQIDFNKAVAAVVDWVNKKSNWHDTLVIVTADHETGYIWGPGSNPTFEPIVNNGKGNVPGMAWYSDIGGFAWHSNSLVPLYAKGDGARFFKSYADEKDLVRGCYLDNTEIFAVMTKCLSGKDHRCPNWKGMTADGNLDMAASSQSQTDIDGLINDGLIIPGH